MSASALFLAIQANDAATVTDLVEALPDLLTARSPSGLTPLLFAAYYQRPQMAQLLMDLGAPVSAHEAAACGAGPRLREQLMSHPELLHQDSPDGFSLLGLCAFFGHTDLAAELIGLGASVDRPSQNTMQVRPLHSAAAGNHTELAELLLAHGADVDARQHGGFTPLMAAAQNGNLELVRVLLDRGADPLMQTEDGRDALSLASEEGHTAVVQLLTELNPR
ncbi:ankyrin repeat domain-containing protein [Deinococcus sonorensis]|uniref:Ankyrin repeat domain-containing protein n=2 Tax=Deinococcus sonorensis TaxID=309891 RepID=A0AAU7U8A5_9DEIO